MNQEKDNYLHLEIIVLSGLTVRLVVLCLGHEDICLKESRFLPSLSRIDRIRSPKKNSCTT
ncbi:hypothetical protein MTR_1g105895 [Medicago truncatula]|uniref:Uncharacterized protein n=1 Tax=Medicago truncatula TaxID=3880 RepID=A0A072VQP3_MEDTR|nr:hypothetical protein MTR_1g105895 [Medicago truncatula]